MKYYSGFKPFPSRQNNARERGEGKQVLRVLHPEVGRAILLRTEKRGKKTTHHRTVLMYAQKIVNM